MSTISDFSGRISNAVTNYVTRGETSKTAGTDGAISLSMKHFPAPIHKGELNLGQKVANGVFFSFCVICPPFTFSYAAVSVMKHAVRERTIAKERDQSIKTYEAKVNNFGGKIQYCQDILLSDKLSPQERQKYQENMVICQQAQQNFINLINTLKSEA